MKDLLLTQLLPQLFDGAIVLLMSAICALVARWTGIQIEGKRRDALQSALVNGAKLLLLPGGTIDHAIDYVLRSVPDALKKFGISDRAAVESYLQPHVLALEAATGKSLAAAQGPGK